MANTRFSTEARESHDSIGNVKLAERNGPLEGSNEGLEFGSLVGGAGGRMAWCRMEPSGREVPGRELATEAASVGVGNTTEVAGGAGGAGACWDRLICLS